MELSANELLLFTKENNSSTHHGQNWLSKRDPTLDETLNRLAESVLTNK